MGKKDSKRKHVQDTAAVPAEKPSKLSRKTYEQALETLQSELVALQNWVKAKGLKVVVVFEGRDAAGKGGIIKTITERVSPRVFKVVALPTPTEREKSQMYMQRYMQHFPAAGEVVLFDRSWYNRAGVERVMGFCTDEEYERFLNMVPGFERTMVENDIILIKYWVDVSMEKQEKRFQDRIDDPRKVWKLSPIDIESYHRWYAYSRARDAMLAVSDTEHAPWTIVPADDKRRARLNCISDLLRRIPYKKLDGKKVKLGKRSLKGRYDDQASMADRRFVLARF